MDFLLSQGANPNGKAYETAALLRATWKGQRQAVDWLLDHGANINATGWFGRHAQGATAIHIAASQGDRELVEHQLHAAPISHCATGSTTAPPTDEPSNTNTAN